MAARLEHQRAPHPIVIPKEYLPPLSHCHMRENRPPAGDDAHRIAAGMGVNTEETMS
jgi:hypothetical protein